MKLQEEVVMVVGIVEMVEESQMSEVMPWTNTREGAKSRAQLFLFGNSAVGIR